MCVRLRDSAVACTSIRLSERRDVRRQMRASNNNGREIRDELPRYALCACARDACVCVL